MSENEILSLASLDPDIGSAQSESVREETSEEKLEKMEEEVPISTSQTVELKKAPIETSQIVEQLEEAPIEVPEVKMRDFLSTAELMIISNDDPEPVSDFNPNDILDKHMEELKDAMKRYTRWLDDQKRDIVEGEKREKQQQKFQTRKNISKSNKKVERETLGDLGVLSQLQAQLTASEKDQEPKAEEEE